MGKDHSKAMNPPERYEGRYGPEYWAERFSDDVPERVKCAIMRVYAAYPPDCLPQGICDPMYIMNVIAYELGIGDGQGGFDINSGR